MMRRVLLITALLMPLMASAYEVRLSEQQLQQEINARLPVTQQRGLFTLEISNAVLTLIDGEDRLRIQADARLITSFGLQSRGKVTLDGKVRYNNQDYSFYIEDPVIRQISIDGVAPELEPQLIELAQQSLTPALRNQPVYTLSDQEMTQNLARMMLKGMRIEQRSVVLVLSL
ncbi:DUF1439 domain-containing protein [Thalassolituus sp. LLYu03]|uniref:DUF1439 domain-containing protein n=1 Tax=Thalassolituus sp. LLYu03 TaxID=3421656 RepID=UPI003D2B1FC7